MNSIIRNVLAVIIGLFLGSVVNMALIMISGSIIPAPEGSEVTTNEGLKASMHLFESKHFIFPFLAHALGTFVGAFLAAKIATNHKMKFALAIGVLFLLGGISAIFMLPSPTWISIVDVVFAYIPMAFFAGKLAIGKKTIRFK